MTHGGTLLKIISKKSGCLPAAAGLYFANQFPPAGDTLIGDDCRNGKLGTSQSADCSKASFSQSADCGVMRKASRLQLNRKLSSTHKNVPFAVFDIVCHHGHGCVRCVGPRRPLTPLSIYLPTLLVCVLVYLLVRVLVHLPSLLVCAIKCGAKGSRPAATFLGREGLDL